MSDNRMAAYCGDPRLLGLAASVESSATVAEEWPRTYGIGDAFSARSASMPVWSVAGSRATFASGDPP